MSFYTTFWLQVRLINDSCLPEEIEQILLYLNSNRIQECSVSLPDAPFFKTPRWNRIKCNFGMNLGQYDSQILIFEPCCSEGINYESGEIQGLINWLKPYCDLTFNRGWIGWKECQESYDGGKTGLFWDEK